MISIDAQFSGSQIARAMQGKTAEMAYFLTEFSDNISPRDVEEIKDHLPFGSASDVAVTMRILANAFDPQ